MWPLSSVRYFEVFFSCTRYKNGGAVKASTIILTTFPTEALRYEFEKSLSPHMRMHTHALSLVDSTPRVKVMRESSRIIRLDVVVKPDERIFPTMPSA